MVGFTAKYLEIRNCIFNGKFVFYNARVSSLFKFGPLPRTHLVRSRRHRAVMAQSHLFRMGTNCIWS